MAGNQKTDSSGSAEGHDESGWLRIHAVAERTGVPEPTLRAWEQRYGIPSPRRTASGYRLYGEREIEQVRRMQKLCAGGMAAAEAARTVKTSTAKKPRTAHEPRDPMHAAQSAILEAVAAFDSPALDTQLQRLLYLDEPVAIVDGVLVPVLHEVGNRWHAGELSVAQEHLVSHRIGTLLRDFVRWIPVAKPAPVALLASFADDEHDLGLLATAVRLAAWGFECVFLGARTPPGALRTAVASLEPALVGLSITVAPDRARGRELVEDYAAAVRPAPWIVGGAGAASIADLVTASGGHPMPADRDALQTLVRSLVRERQSRASRRPLRRKG